MAITLHSSIAGVNSKTAGTTTSTAGQSLITTAGDLVVVVFAMDNAAGTVSCADNEGAGDAFVVQSDVTNSGGVRTVILSAITNHTGSSYQVTVTHPSVTARAVHIRSFTPTAGSTMDATATAQNTGTGTTTATTSNSVTPTADNQLVVGCCGSEDVVASQPITGFPSWATDYKAAATSGGGDASNITIGTGYEIQTTATARDYNPTLQDGAADSANCIACFREIAAAARVPRPVIVGQAHQRAAVR